MRRKISALMGFLATNLVVVNGWGFSTCMMGHLLKRITKQYCQWFECEMGQSWWGKYVHGLKVECDTIKYINLQFWNTISTIFSCKINVQMSTKIWKTPQPRGLLLSSGVERIAEKQHPEASHPPFSTGLQHRRCRISLEVQLVVSFPSSRLGKTFFSHHGSMEMLNYSMKGNESWRYHP